MRACVRRRAAVQRGEALVWGGPCHLLDWHEVQDRRPQALLAALPMAFLQALDLLLHPPIMLFFQTRTQTLNPLSEQSAGQVGWLFCALVLCYDAKLFS